MRLLKKYVNRRVELVGKREPIELGNGIHLIDGFDMGEPGRTGSYVIEAEQLTIVETSASPSVPYILAGLEQLGHRPEDVRYIIVTHIHLDHSGGAGLLLQHCPHAQVVVHPKGARHLIDPERLIASAKMVYGNTFNQFFDPIVPVPQDRIIVKADEETLAIGPGRTLTFLDTPGHANHHFSIYDPFSKGIFTGDTLGVYYHQLRDLGLSFYLPSTSPNQFNPEAMAVAIERVKALQVERIYFGHFGMSEEPEEVYRQLYAWLPRFIDAAQTVAEEGGDYTVLSARMTEQITEALDAQGVARDHAVYSILPVDMDVCAMGLLDYIQRRAKA